MKFSDFQNLIIQLPWHPIYTVCQGILVGIALHQDISKGIACLLVCAFAHLFFKNFSPQTAVLIFAISLVAGSYRIQQVEHSFYQSVLAGQKSLLSLQGELAQKEAISATHVRYTVQITTAQEKSRMIPALRGWYVTITAPHTDNVTIGDLVAWERAYFSLSTNNQEYRTFLINRSSLGNIRTKESPKQLARPLVSIRRNISNFQELLITKIHTYTNSETAALIETIFLGKKQQLKSPVHAYRKTFQTWGISHYLARSGLHLSLLALLVNIIALACIPWFAGRVWLLLILSFIYTLFSWTSISFIRALIFLGIISIGNLRKRPPHTLVIFAWVTTITLLTSPHQFFALDFQLSFLLSGFLIWLNQINFFQSLAK
ncbi:MAG: ComEC [candidate division TM6 bacterium GW2011_GWF2_43_17]|nr:MAG: ComEC [candidate division TM6 bacterium GW2011_GWF2_43_17]HAU30101.1 hypothetical protein [Candidatus Dependentiae bacterium]